MDNISEADLILNKDGSVYHLNLLPEHIGETIIGVGDPERVAKVSQYFDHIDFRTTKREFTTHTGILRGKKISVISTGMGTDNIEIFLTELDALVNIDLRERLPNKQRKKLDIIRIGTSGSLQEDIPLDCHVITEYAIGLDSLMHFYAFEMDNVEESLAQDIKRIARIPFLPYVVKGSTKLLERLGANLIRGNTVTTPGFYAPQGRTVRLSPKHPMMIKTLSNYRQNSTGFRLTNFEMETAGYYSLGRLLGHETVSLNAIVADRVGGRFSENPEQTIDVLIRTVLARL